MEGQKVPQRVPLPGSSRMVVSLGVSGPEDPEAPSPAASEAAKQARLNEIGPPRGNGET